MIASNDRDYVTLPPGTEAGSALVPMVAPNIAVFRLGTFAH